MTLFCRSILLCALAFLIGLPAFAQTPAEPSSGETWLAVSINDQPAGDVALFIRQANGDKPEGLHKCSPSEGESK